jgi:hypothetical protein
MTRERDEALATIEQALRELMHCIEVGPRWFTRGERGMHAHSAAWMDKAAEAMAVLRVEEREGASS